MIYEAVDPNANIIFGALVDESMNGEIAITVIATGFPVISPVKLLNGTCLIARAVLIDGSERLSLTVIYLVTYYLSYTVLTAIVNSCAFYR